MGKFGRLGVTRFYEFVLSKKLFADSNGLFLSHFTSKLGQNIASILVSKTSLGKLPSRNTMFLLVVGYSF